MTEQAKERDRRDAAPEDGAHDEAGQAERAAAADRQPDAGSGGDGDLESLGRKAEENWNNYLRAVAELDNFRKRSARELEMARRYGAERLGQAILPVRDSIEAALSAENVTVETLLEGERATLKLLDDALAEVGIREIDPLGEPFDPTKHEAMTMQPSEEHEPNTVVIVVQKGYELHDRLLRPARVVVAAPAPQGAA